MSIKKKINADHIEAFKNRDQLKKTLLSTVKGEITTQEKNQVTPDLSDQEVIKILNKFVKGLKETLKHNPDFGQAKKELVILEGYLPKELDESEIRLKVQELKASGATNIGVIMKGFVGLQVDRNLVSKVAKEELSTV